MTFNILCHRLLPPYSLLSMPKIWHITVRNIEIFFCFCKLDDFSAHKFSAFTGYLLPLQSGNLRVGTPKVIKAQTKLGALEALGALGGLENFPEGEIGGD